MPLFEMSANVQEPNAARKRSHDEYSDDAGEDVPMSDKTPSKPDVRPSGDSRESSTELIPVLFPANLAVLPPVSNNLLQSSPQGSPALTEAGSSTAACNSPSPETPTKTGAAPPAQTSNPAKRKKLTPAEREARDKEAAERKEQKEREAALKKKERDEKAAQRAAEKAKQEEEKAARQKEKDEKRKKKEEEEKLKAEQREEKRRQKEEEEKRIQEEKDKKARAQPKLMSFFKQPDTPKKPAAAVANSSPAKGDATLEEAKETEYQKMFQPFFLKENTRMAPSSCNMDEETREAKSRILDECIEGKRGENVAFDPVSLFSLPGASTPRGKLHQPVRHIMEAAYKEMERSETSGVASADTLQAARKQLKGIPVKVIAFSRDVRPPYYGTITYRPFALGAGNMRRVARRSASRRLQLEYDYDSEAEWQEEEGEDLDGDDDDEELDDEDDMDGFLDDSEDSGLSRRTFGNTMEPECTGICFENENRKGPSQAAHDNKMEMILGMCNNRFIWRALTSLDVFQKTATIDPFSTSYWEPEPKPAPAKAPAKTAATAEKMPPPPAPSNAFAALTGAAPDSAPAKLVKAELLNDVKKAILDNKALSKVGIVDFIFHQFRDNVSRIEVKNTLELVAEKKKGAGKMKEWDLKPGHEITL